MKKIPFELSIEPDPCPNYLVDLGPNSNGVGSWVPEEKHTLLAKMIGGTRGAREKWSKRIWIDPFCGPGRIQVKGKTFTRDGGSVVAWRQSLEHKVPFTKMLVGDLVAERANACDSRLRAIGAPVQSFVGAAVDTVKKMKAEIPAGSLSLAYIDPYNLEHLSFSIIEELATLKSIDFAVHFSTMDLQRNVDMELDPLRARFDNAAPGWREELSAKNLSKSTLKQEFFTYWRGLVERHGFVFSKEMPLVRDAKNTPLYRLVFFSRHAFPNRIWDDVARNRNLGFDF